MIREFALLGASGIIAFSPAAVARGIHDHFAATTAASMSSRSAVASVPATSVVTLNITGMTCGGCAIAARKVLTRLDGVSKADVSYEKGNAVVTYDPAKTDAQKMIAAIKTLGYTAVVAP